MNNGVKRLVMQLWHKSKTTRVVGQAGQTSNSCGLPLLSNGPDKSRYKPGDAATNDKKYLESNTFV